MSLSPIALLEFTATCFENVPTEIMALLLVGSRMYDVAASRLIFPYPDPSPRVALVLAGTARSFLTAADGRQLTVRYARRGALIGKYSDLSGDHAPLAAQAISDSTVLEFDVETFSRVARSEISVSTAIVEELARRLDDVYATVGATAFGTARQCVTRHLLALAAPAANSEWSTANVTQQQIADGIGSSREVVARILAQLRTEGLIRTRPRAIELLGVDQLAASLNHWQPESPY